MCVLLWAHHGQREALVAYEDSVLAFLPEHGGRVVRRVPTLCADGQPDEIQFLDFAARENIASFMADPRRTALEPVRDAAIARTDVLFLVDPLPG